MNDFDFKNSENKSSAEQIEKVIAQRERKRYLEELSDLEHELASASSKIFYTSLSLLIFEPLVTAGIAYYLWDQISKAWATGATILGLSSNIKWVATGIAFSFASTSLTLLFYLWKVSSIHGKMAKLRRKINRLG